MKRRPRVCFVMARADGPGGEARTITNLANALSRTYDVELISLFRQRTRPTFPIDRRVRVTWVMDLRPTGPDGKRRNLGRDRAAVLAAQRPSRVVPGDDIHWESSDEPLAAAIRRSRADIMVGTRPGLIHFIGLHARLGVLLLGQDHMNYAWRTRRPGRDAFMREGISRLAGFATLTAGDIAPYRELVGDVSTTITAIPNALTWPRAPYPAELVSPVVIAAGRLDDYKGFDRLVEAYVPVARARPEWQLHVYGKGPMRPVLEAMVEEAGVGDQIRLMGYTRDPRDRMTEASIYAMASRAEGFPMVLLEAMSVGLPLIAYDVATGPAEVIVDGANGRLIADGDREAYSAALLAMIDDADGRRLMGEEAWRSAASYELPAIVARWEELFALREINARASWRRAARR